MDQVATLQLESVDLQISRNNREHHTQEMGVKRLTVRRGQLFYLRLSFSRPFQSQSDHITFVAETGPKPSELLGTRATFFLTRVRPGNVWSASDFTIDSNSLHVSLFTPANAVIGHYILKIEISQGQGHSVTYPLGTFILLFNPWSPEDDVYLPSEILLQEYVMQDYGFVYKGHERFITSWPWNYGQFEEDIIDICFEILNKSLHYLKNPAKDCSQRNDVVYVCRVVSAMINSNDDNGVLQGNWSEDYSEGVSPLEWNGSVAILRQWSARGGQPVKYGQCWVFASVMCTVMRCLGVPTRVVSNFRSAHNVDRNLTIDTYYDRNAEMLSTQKRDKIWNFHVWNECWMIRKDLPPGYNGWQVLDPTPQQTSSGSPEERAVFMKASRKMLGPQRASSPFLDLLESGGLRDEPAQLQLHLARIPEWGQDLQLLLRIRRVPDSTHPQGPIGLVVRFCAQALLHGGGTRKPLWRHTVRVNLDFGKETQWPLLLPHSNYRSKLTDEKLIRVSGIAEVEETGRSMLVLKDISLEPPHLSIEVSERAEVGKALRVHVTLTNTLMVALSSCTMVLEGSGLVNGQITKDLGTLVAGHTLQIQLDLYPTKAGPRQLQVLISSNEVKEIKGYKDIFVTAAGAP
ncbi:PREDICTED: protein-glutamine gamma-glutamyltransferase Z isoform X2 [Cercocebus atys]|uniref:protein-glutamine gamma-glutamyltransferase Z isoform X2 n=1 Tax=Cercocebus atys TaxID=9531 RepID=UPI0005F4E5EB|nr:PREDICTED: protein-glutamine gamma-glutamyltransferase Z isoform X2 [Cercocebus atys]